MAIFGPPPVRGVGRAGGFAIFIEDRGDSGPVAMQTQIDQHCPPARVCLHPPPRERAPVPAAPEQTVEKKDPALGGTRPCGELGVGQGGHPPWN